MSLLSLKERVPPGLLRGGVVSKKMALWAGQSPVLTYFGARRVVPRRCRHSLSPACPAVSSCTLWCIPASRTLTFFPISGEEVEIQSERAAWQTQAERFTCTVGLCCEPHVSGARTWCVCGCSSDWTTAPWRGRFGHGRSGPCADAEPAWLCGGLFTASL